MDDRGPRGGGVGKFSLNSILRHADQQDCNNCEVRVFTFLSADDDEAVLVEFVEDQQSGVVDRK